MKNILITGVSSGIGSQLLQEFINRGYHVYGAVRKESSAKELQELYGEKITPLICDLTDAKSIEMALTSVKPILEKEGLVGIINNAGVAKAGPLLHQSIEEHKEQFDINVWGQLRIIQAFTPFLGTAMDSKLPKGRILNITSTSGRIAMPFMGGYGASKAALELLTDALRCELQLYGIPVINIRPGLIVTPIWDKAEVEDSGDYLETDFGHAGEKFKHFLLKEGRGGMPVALFAQKVRTIFEKKKPRCTYTIIPSRFKNWIVPNLLPRKLLDDHLGKLVGLIKTKK